MKSAEALKNDPPKIIVMTPRDPDHDRRRSQRRKIKDTEFERVFNTTFPIVYDPDDKEYYFYGTSVWFKTEDLISGEWEYVKSLRTRSRNCSRQIRHAAGGPSRGPGGRFSRRPEKAKIVVATVPAELIVCIGEPIWLPLPETSCCM